MAKKFWERKGFDIKTFTQTFGGIYSLYYNNPCEETDEAGMMRVGDRLLKEPENGPLLKMLAECRMDILTSDREVAAFAVTYGVYQQRF